MTRGLAPQGCYFSGRNEVKRFVKKVLRALSFRSKERPFKVSSAFSEMIASETYNKVVLTHEGVAVPPIIARDKVRKSAVMAEEFILEGQQAFLAIKDILAQNNVRVGHKTNIFEFGVGCGRIARHFLGSNIGSFQGSDVDDQLTSWCTDVLANKDARFSFFKNEYFPPLAVKESTIDILFSISVFTHMQKAAQEAWLREMSKPIKPGGHLLLSIIEDSEDQLRTGIRVRERIDGEYKREWFGVGDAPETYFSTANTSRYITDNLKDNFQFVAGRSKAIRGRQSLLLYKKTS